MHDEYSIFESGYDAVLAEVDRDDGSLNLDVLAQACGRKARSPSATRAESIGWATAAIACYHKTGQHRVEGFDRQGSEVILFGLMVSMISKWGPEANSEVLDPVKVVRWIQDGFDPWPNPASFGDALRGRGSETAIDREAVLCLEERLKVGRGLFDLGMLPAAMEVWLRQAGLLT